MLILSNQELYRNGFPYPLTVTGGGQAASALAGLALGMTRALPLQPPPRGAAGWAPLLPVIAATFATMLWGNAAYLHLSMSFIQILKAATPALTLLLGVAAGVEAAAPTLVTAVVLIAAGTGYALNGTVCMC